MADPLNLLRQYNVSKQQIIERENHIIFGEYSWPKTAKTNYLTYGCGKEGTAKEYYTLECLLYFLKHVYLTHPAYVRQAAAENIPVVRRPDRKDLLAYLNGEIATSTAIDKLAPLEIATHVKRMAEDDTENVATKKQRIEEAAHMQKVKEQLVAKLDTPKEMPLTVDNIKSLSEAMSVEKIAAIKAKRMAKKRTTIKKNKDIDMNIDLQILVDMDEEDIKEIVSKERVWQTRNTILQSSGKEFAKDIIAILTSVQMKEDSARRGLFESPAPVTVAKVTPAHQSLLPQPSIYNRYDQERFANQREETEGFKIFTKGSYHGMSLKSVTAGDNSFLKKANFNINETNHLLPVSAAKLTPEQANQNKRMSKTPIIIVPSANNSLISMYNAKEILQDLRYITSEEKKNQGYKKESEFLLQRKKEGGLTVPYRVVDNPLKLTNEDWDRVVALFAAGPAWQFKGWPFGGNPVEIFSKICAFHLKYKDIPAETNIRRWAVNVIDIDKHRRHLDRADLMQFWRILDKHIIRTNKIHLRW